MERDYHTKLTFDKDNEYRPVWSPSGESVVFARDVDGVGNLYWKRANGTGETHRLTETSYGQFPWSWHPEGRYIAVNETSAEGRPNLRIVELQGDDSHGWEAIGTTDFESTQYTEVTGSFSPDGNWLAFASNEPGQFQVFVRPFGKAGVRKQISLSNSASYLPAWTLESNELIFATNTTGHKTGERQIMAAEYSTKDEVFNVGQAESWKAGRFFQKQGFKSFDVHPDGTRLLIRKLAEGEEEPIFDHVVFFENFAEYLKQEVPTGIE